MAHFNLKLMNAQNNSRSSRVRDSFYMDRYSQAFNGKETAAVDQESGALVPGQTPAALIVQV
jgi:hypothetical protein